MLDGSIIRASDLMNHHLITVTPDTTALALQRLFVDEHLHGAPVVGDDGVVQGVVSALDLLRIIRHELELGAHATTSYYEDALPYPEADWERTPDHFRNRMQKITAAEAMSHEVVMVRPDAPLDEVVRILSAHRLHRVLVGDHGVLQGVITAFDLLPVLSRFVSRHGNPIQSTGYSRGDLT